MTTVCHFGEKGGTLARKFIRFSGQRAWGFLRSCHGIKQLCSERDPFESGSSRGQPAALQRQALNASARWDDSSSVSSWCRLDEDAHGLGARSMPQVPEDQQVLQPPGSEATQAAQPNVVPPPPPPGGPSSSFPPATNAAPAVQAAQSILGHANEVPASRRLRRQQEQAARRGRRAFRWGQMSPGDLAHNPLDTQLPGHLSQVGSNEGERSVLIMDNRDNRIQSPFQGWLIDEVLTNALSYVNIKSDRSLVRSPSSGYHFSLFMVRSSHRSWSRSSKAGE